MWINEKNDSANHFFIVLSAGTSGKGMSGNFGNSSPSAVRITDRITLVVDDTRFVVEPEIFRQYPDTMLGRSVGNCYFSGLEMISVSQDSKFSSSEY